MADFSWCMTAIDWGGASRRRPGSYRKSVRRHVSVSSSRTKAIRSLLRRMTPPRWKETIKSGAGHKTLLDCVARAASFADLRQVMLLGKFLHMHFDGVAIGTR
jgi:hypothetical protein